MRNKFFTNKFRVLKIAVFFFLIMILGTAFHQPVQIVDALSSRPVSGFSVHISVWRVLFEPFVGPLLFLLRANQALNEILVMMIWLAAALLIMAVVRGFKVKTEKRWTAVGKKILQWLATVPLIYIIWLALLLIIIFAPLPSNKIVNHEKDTILLDIHSHTHFSHDGIISPKGQIKWHGRNGFDAFFITDHNNHNKTLETIQAQKTGQLPAKPLVLCGEEFSGSNHILLLGLQRDFKTRGMADSTAIDSTHANNGVAIVAHWFEKKKRTIQYYIDSGVDGFEIANQGTAISYDRKIFDDIFSNCQSNNLLMLGACDYHGYGSACAVWNALTIPGWHQMTDEQKRSSIMSLLRRHDQDKIKVLLYRDRELLDHNTLYLSPLYSMPGYFRSLNIYQLLSWVIWVIFLCWFWVARLEAKIKQLMRKRPFLVWGILGSISALIVGITGAVFLIKAKSLVGYNDIYLENGKPFLWQGIGFFIYALILMLMVRFKRNDS